MDDDAIEVGDPESTLSGTSVEKISIPVTIPNDGLYPVSPEITVKIYKKDSSELVGEGTEKFTVNGRSEKEVDLEIDVVDSFQSDMATFDGQLDIVIEIEGKYAWFIPIPGQEIEKTVDYNGPL